MLRINNKKDILLLLLFSPGVKDEFNEPIKGRTRILKMLFLFKEEILKHFKKNTDINDDNFYEYFAWRFGPFSVEVYDDITFFLLRDFITTQDSDGEFLTEAVLEERHWQFLSSIQLDDTQGGYHEFTEEKFLLTDKGVNFTEKYFNILSESQKNLLRVFKKKMNTAPLRAILQYVYKTYPDMTENSQIKQPLIGS